MMGEREPSPVASARLDSPSRLNRAKWSKRRNAHIGLTGTQSKIVITDALNVSFGQYRSLRPGDKIRVREFRNGCALDGRFGFRYGKWLTTCAGGEPPWESMFKSRSPVHRDRS